MTDDVLDEVRRVREAYAERFNFDLGAIFRDLRERELASGRELVSLPPRRIVPMVEVPLIADDEADSGSGLTSAAVKAS